MPQSPHLALLNYLFEFAPKNTQRLIFLILMGAELTIAKAWKHPSVSFLIAERKISWGGGVLCLGSIPYSGSHGVALVTNHSYLSSPPFFPLLILSPSSILDPFS